MPAIKLAKPGLFHKKRNAKLGLILFISFSSLAVLAQPSDCQIKLDQAWKLYELARFQEVTLLLEGCLGPESLSAEDRAFAVFFLRRAYNAQGRFEAADSIYQYAVREGIEKPRDWRWEYFDPERNNNGRNRYQNPSERMSLARAALEAHPEKAAGLLASLVDSTRLGRSLKVEALELLAEAYLKLGQPGAADTSLRRIFLFRPQYQPGSNRSLNYRQFAERYASVPRYSFALAAGLNGIRPYSFASYSVPDVQIGKETYQARYAPHAELQFAFRPKGLNRLNNRNEGIFHKEKKVNWEFFFGLGYVWDSYEYEGSYSNVLGPSGQRQDANVSFREQQQKISLSALMLAVLPNPWAGKWKRQRLADPEAALVDEERLFPQILRRLEPYAGAGIGAHRLGAATLQEPAILYARDGALIGDDIVMASRQSFFGSLESDAGPAQRAEYLFNLQGRLGVKYRVNRTYYFVEGGYAWTPANMVAASAREANSALIDKYHYLDNDLRQHHLGISVGIGHSIYYTIWK